jgi:hypothetical protein
VTHSETYQVKLLDSFNRTYQQIIKKHYKVDDKSREELEELFGSLVTFLSKTPKIQPPRGRMEPWPKKTFEEGWLLWKLDIPMPGLTGAVGQGRIMYLIHEGSRTVQLFWIYTHADYATRPPDDEIKRILRAAMKD